MQRNKSFVLRQVAGKSVVIPLGQAAETFRGMITLNETGRFLWELLQTPQTEQSLAEALARTYGIEEERARNGVRSFLDGIRATGAIEED